MERQTHKENKAGKGAVKHTNCMPMDTLRESRVYLNRQDRRKANNEMRILAAELSSLVPINEAMALFTEGE